MKYHPVVYHKCIYWKLPCHSYMIYLLKHGDFPFLCLFGGYLYLFWQLPLVYLIVLFWWILFRGKCTRNFPNNPGSKSPCRSDSNHVFMIDHYRCLCPIQSHRSVIFHICIPYIKLQYAYHGMYISMYHDSWIFHMIPECWYSIFV